MARFFFDLNEGDTRTSDDTGTLLERSAVPAEARRLLLDVTRDLPVTADHYRVEVSVRDDGGVNFHWSSIVLDRGWV